MKEKTNLFWFFLILIGLNACNSDRIFEEYQGLPGMKWVLQDTVSFDMPDMDPNLSYSEVGIRYNDTYGFRNLYVRYVLTDSMDKVVADSLINIPLFDSKTGRPLGDGFGNVYTIYDTLPQLTIPASGRVKAKFIQYMRKEELQGIEAVGIRINRN